MLFRYKHVPAFSFGKGGKMEIKSAMPGPGTYDYQKGFSITQKMCKTTALYRP